MRVQSWSHVGVTVSDFNRAVRFYWDVFGCPLVGVSDAPPDRVRGFFGDCRSEIDQGFTFASSVPSRNRPHADFRFERCCYSVTCLISVICRFLPVSMNVDKARRDDEAFHFYGYFSSEV